MKFFRLVILLIPFFYLTGCSDEKGGNDQVAGDSANAAMKNQGEKGDPGTMDMHPTPQSVHVRVNPDSIAIVTTRFVGTKHKTVALKFASDSTLWSSCSMKTRDTILKPGDYTIVPYFSNDDCGIGSSPPLSANHHVVLENTGVQLNVAYKNQSMPSDSTYITIVMEEHIGGGGDSVKHDHN